MQHIVVEQHCNIDAWFIFIHFEPIALITQINTNKSMADSTFNESNKHYKPCNTLPSA